MAKQQFPQTLTLYYNECIHMLNRQPCDWHVGAAERKIIAECFAAKRPITSAVCYIMRKVKQITRTHYGFVPGNAVAVATLTRVPGARRPYVVEYVYRDSVDVHAFKSFRFAAQCYRGDCFARRHGFNPAEIGG